MSLAYLSVVEICADLGHVRWSRLHEGLETRGAAVMQINHTVVLWGGKALLSSLVITLHRCSGVARHYSAH